MIKKQIGLKQQLLSFLAVGLSFTFSACNGSGNLAAANSMNSNLTTNEARLTAVNHRLITEHAYLPANDRIMIYQIDATGFLNEIGQALAPSSGVASVAVTPNNKFAYATVAKQDQDCLLMYSINESGLLTPLSPSSIKVSTGPKEISITPDGKYLYFTDWKTIEMFSINQSTGQVSKLSPSSVSTGGSGSPWEIVVSKDGKYAYVNNATDNFITTFVIDPATGVLKSPIKQALPHMSQSMALHPNGQYLYTTLEDDSKVGQYSINNSSGALSALNPETLAAGNQPLDNTITLNGKFMYVVNKVDKTVGLYTIDPSIGLLYGPYVVANTIGQPTRIASDPSGKFVYISANDGKEYLYKINAKDGTLSALATAYIDVLGPNYSPGKMSFTNLQEATMIEPPVGARANVSESTNIVLKFPSDVDPATINSNSVEIIEYTKLASVTNDSHVQYVPIVSETVLYSLTIAYGAYLFATFDPDKYLKDAASVKVKLHGVKRYDGTLLKDRIFTFNTHNEQMFLIQPIDTANAPENTLISVGFALPIKKSTVNANNFYITLTGDDKHVEGISGWNGNSLNFQANEKYFPGKSYQIHIDDGIKGKNGTEIQATTLNFKTSNDPNSDLIIYEAMGEVNPNGGYFGYSGQMQGLEGADRRCNNDVQKPRNCQGSCYFKAMVATKPHVDTANPREALGRYICQRRTLATGEVVVRCGVGHNQDWVLAPNQRYINYNGQEIGTTDQYQRLPNPLLNAIDPIGALEGQFSLPARTALDPEWVPMQSQCYYLTSGSADVLTSYGTPATTFTPDVIARAITNCVVPQGLICVEQPVGVY